MIINAIWLSKDCHRRMESTSFCFLLSGGRLSLGKLDIDISQVKKLVELVENYGLEELTIEEADLSITVKGHVVRVAPQMVVQAGEAAPVAEVYEESIEVEEVHAAEVLEGNIVDITAPLVGVFYRAPAPDSPNFVEIGDIIEIGSEVGLIEAMKVFSPIPSEIAGEVVDIPVENGKLVREGEVLIRIRVPEE
jgi:acetyl-CoA carboxylase biotin carboxyl carrier protein